MRFLISVIDNATGSASPEEMKSINAFNDQLAANGHWILACGLAAPQTSSVIDNRDGANIVTDGPLIVSPEYLSGFWLIEAPDELTAHELARHGSQACNRRVELRPLLG
jgi:hypothetical protein